MRLVYLDRQIVIDHFKGDGVVEAVARFCTKGAAFPYSPAHIEEIAKAHHTAKGAPLQDQLSHMARLSGGLAIMPNATGPAEVRIEDINACLSRVQDGNGRLSTEHAVGLERLRINTYAKFEGGRSWEDIRDTVERCEAHNVFSNPYIFQHMETMARTKGFRIRIETFQEREATIEALFDVLNMFGFRKEYSEKRTENRVHDVSHAIYGSYADMFVTDDRKLRQSAEAVFHCCRINVDVVGKDEFIARALDP